MANLTSGQSSNSNDNKRPDIPIVDPDDSGKYIQGIVLQYGYDSVSGIWGAGYSYDNGAHFFVTDTVYGRKYRQEDADRLWPYLKKYIGGTSGTVTGSIKWADILDKPEIVTVDYLNQRLSSIAQSGQITSLDWGQITNKPDLATKDDLKKISLGDTSLSIEAISDLIKRHLRATIDMDTGNLVVNVDEINDGSIADAVAAKVAETCQFKLDNGNLVLQIGGK